MSHSKKVLAGQDGEGYTDVAVLILCVVPVLALSVKILSVSVAKQQLDTSATELCREAEIADRTGSETSRGAAVLREKTGLNPEIHWSASGRIQLNEEVTVQLTCRYNLELFGGFGSFPTTLHTATTGKPEVYWKRRNGWYV